MHGFKGDLPNKIKYKTTWKSTIGNKIVETYKFSKLYDKHQVIKGFQSPKLKI